MRGLRTGLALGFGWRTVFAFVHDVAMAAAAFVLALYLRLGDRLMEQAGPFLAYGTVIFAAVAALVFLLVGLHRGIWRYASMNDLIAILRAATLVILIYLPIMFVLSRLDGMPRSALLIGWFVLIFLLGAPRFVYRVLKDRSFAHLLERGGAPRVPVLLVGAGDAAETFIREMARDAGAPFEVVGLIDPSGRSTGQRIRGVPVLGDLAGAPAALARLRRGGRAPQRLIVAQEPLGRAGMPACPAWPSCATMTATRWLSGRSPSPTCSAGRRRCSTARRWRAWSPGDGCWSPGPAGRSAASWSARSRRSGRRG